MVENWRRHVRRNLSNRREKQGEIVVKERESTKIADFLQFLRIRPKNNKGRTGTEQTPEHGTQHATPTDLERLGKPQRKAVPPATVSV
jgi:hypothetical protein